MWPGVRVRRAPRNGQLDEASQGGGRADGPVCLSAGPAVAGILSNPNMQKLLANASLELDPERQAKLEETHESPLYGVQWRLLSAVNSVFLSNTNTTKLDPKVTFAFSHPVSPGAGRGQPHCSPSSQGQSGPSVAHLHPLCSFLKPQGLCACCALCLGHLSLT